MVISAYLRPICKSHDKSRSIPGMPLPAGMVAEFFVARLADTVALSRVLPQKSVFYKIDNIKFMHLSVTLKMKYKQVRVNAEEP